MTSNTPTIALSDDRVAQLAADAGDPFDARAAERWSWRLVWLGIAVRVVRFLCAFPIWQDEQFLAVNLIDRDYLGLFQGLDLNQAAPIGFLLVSKWFATTLGFGEYVLRIPAIICGCAALVVFRQLAARLLSGTALVAAVGVMAVSYFPIRHAAELKPYAGDLLLSAWLILWALDWRREPERLGRATRFIALAVVAPFFSFPAVFIVGAVGLWLLPEVVRRRSPRFGAAFAAFGLAAVAALFVLFRISIAAQLDTVHATGSMHRYWATEFPPSPREPLRWPAWLLEAHTGECLAYPIGSKHSGSIVSAALIYFGAWSMWRRGRGWLPGLAAVLAGLALLAACLHRYPYGNGERVQQYWAPLFCLFFGVGTAALVCRAQRFEVRRRAGRAVVLATLVLGVVWTLDAHLRGYKHRWDVEHQAFSRWFWRFGSDGVPQIDVCDDLGRQIYPRELQNAYRVHREIYAPVRAKTDVVGDCPAGATVDCVAFELEGSPRDEAQFTAWMATMQRQYRLVSERTYSVLVDAKPGKSAVYHVWRFAPLAADVRLADVIAPPPIITADRRR